MVVIVVVREKVIMVVLGHGHRSGVVIVVKTV